MVRRPCIGHYSDVMLTENSRPDRTAIAAVPANNRSAVTNGALGIDLRTRVGRRFRDVYLDAMNRTDGRNPVLCRSLAGLVVRREALDAAIVSGADVSTDELLRLASEVRRTLTRLGLDAGGDEEPVEDGTAAAIAALRAHRTGEVA